MRRTGPVGDRRRVHGAVVLTFIRGFLNRTCTIVGLGLILRDVRGITWIWTGRLWQRWLAMSVGGTCFRVQISFFVDQDWFHAIPVSDRLMRRTRRRRPRILWTHFGGISRLVRRCPVNRHRISMLRLQRNWRFGIWWFLPCVTHRIAFADKSASKAVVTYGFVRKYRLTSSMRLHSRLRGETQR